MVVVPIVFIGWAGTAVATAAVITVAISTLVPLLILAAGFESVFALHVNMERIGRYLQVFHEEPEIGWEGVAARFGQRYPGAAPDPLFSRLFVLATSVFHVLIVAAFAYRFGVVEDDVPAAAPRRRSTLFARR